ncbi:hypothetical protein OHB11_07900 [Streptomyces zaomyceticus]|uniref:hypothetical protein n=1 Tax=Streptomyces zaomyceticus TaxID=68286 RepID=UPI00324B3498
MNVHSLRYAVRTLIGPWVVLLATVLEVLNFFQRGMIACTEARRGRAGAQANRRSAGRGDLPVPLGVLTPSAA